MSDWTGGVCIFGPRMAWGFKEMPYYSTSMYLFFVPLFLSVMTLGKAIAMATYRPVFVILTLIILTDIARLIFNSVYTCNGGWIMLKGWWWFALCYEGQLLQNYVLFIYWYVWYEAYKAKDQETKLLLLLECGEFSGNSAEQTA